MYFLLIGRDGKDAGAFERRAKAQLRHSEMAKENFQAKKLLYGTAILDETGNKIGSVMIFDFPDRQALESYLETEPFVVTKVWENLEITRCQPGAFFLTDKKA